MDNNPRPLYLQKLIFVHFACCVIMKREHEGQSYSTLYYKKIITTPMHMYCTPKWDISEYFRVELIQFISVILSTIVY